jgi:thiamine monophosphate synthase
MVLGEAGADYVWFGTPQRLDEDRMTDAAWWQALFEVPAIAAGPCEFEAIDSLIATQVEFIAVDVFSGIDDPGDRVAEINARLDRRVVPS